MGQRGITRRLRMLLIVVPMLAAAAGAASAQMDEFLALRPPLTAREAFASPYGSAVVDALAAALERAADPACAGNAGASAQDWKNRAEALFVRHGQAYLVRQRSLVDRRLLEQEVRRLGGAAAIDELRRLSRDPSIAALGEPIRIRQIVQLVDTTAEMFDRVVLLSRRSLERIAPLATGSEPLLRLREEIDEDALDAFHGMIRFNDMPEMRRFVELIGVAAEAMYRTIDGTAFSALSPMDWMPGLDGDLADLCIGTR